VRAFTARGEEGGRGTLSAGKGKKRGEREKLHLHSQHGAILVWWGQLLFGERRGGGRDSNLKFPRKKKKENKNQKASVRRSVFSALKIKTERGGED